MKLHISTPYGDGYDIMENGNIVRLDIKDFQPSGNWRFLGLERLRDNFGHTEFIPFSQLTPERIKEIQKEIRFKNGHCRYTVRDWDHGTTRIWGNMNVHGLATINIIL